MIGGYFSRCYARKLLCLVFLVSMLPLTLAFVFIIGIAAVIIWLFGAVAVFFIGGFVDQTRR